MRPPEFTGGNWSIVIDVTGELQRFNEAAGIHRRKLVQGEVTVSLELPLQ